MRVNIECNVCHRFACSIEAPAIDEKSAFMLKKMAAFMGGGAVNVSALLEPGTLTDAMDVHCAACSAEEDA